MIKRDAIDLVLDFNAPTNRRFTAIQATIDSMICNRHPSLSGVSQLQGAFSVVDINNQTRALLLEVGGR